MGDTPRPALCIGESLVDLICERPVESFEESDAFAPHLGGAATNVAVHAAREGARVALAGVAGDDPWGRWLQRRLREERVDLRFWRLLAGAETAVAFARVADLRRWHRSGLVALGPVLEEAVGRATSPVLGSNAMLREAERRVSLRARTLALARGAHRWRGAAEAINLARLMCEGSPCRQAERHEATLLTREADPSRAAHAVCSLGPESRS